MDEKRDRLEKQSDSRSLPWFNSASTESKEREREISQDKRVKRKMKIKMSALATAWKNEGMKKRQRGKKEQRDDESGVSLKE